MYLGRIDQSGFLYISLVIILGIGAFLASWLSLDLVPTNIRIHTNRYSIHNTTSKINIYIYIYYKIQSCVSVLLMNSQSFHLIGQKDDRSTLRSFSFQIISISKRTFRKTIRSIDIYSSFEVPASFHPWTSRTSFWLDWSLKCIALPGTQSLSFKSIYTNIYIYI